MSISDRIYYILADGTPLQSKFERLVGKPSSSLIPSAQPVDEYVEDIDLTQPIIDQRLSVYFDSPVANTVDIAA